MSNKHNLLYETWADRPEKMKMKKKAERKKQRKREKIKTKMFIKNSKCTYVYIANTDKDCDLLCNRPILSTERMFHDKSTTILTTTKVWS
jgi:hypothetical protein